MFIHFSPAEWRRESEKWKWQNSFIEIKSLINKAVCAQVKQNKKFIQSFPSVQPCSGKPWSITCYSDLGKQMLQLSTSILPFSSAAFIADHNVIWHGTSLWSVVISCPSCVPSQLLMLPHPGHWQGSVKNREILDAVQWLLSSSYNIHVLSTLFWSKNPISTIRIPMKKINSIRVRLSTSIGIDNHQDSKLLSLQGQCKTY